MLLLITFSIETSLLVGSIAVVAFTLGFILRSVQLKKLKGKVSDLEREMVASHAEILELQKERLALEAQLKGSNIPVIPISVKEEKKSDKLQDKSVGKK